MLKNGADNVIFVHRDQSSDGRTVENSGVIYIAKARNGQLGGVGVFFDGDRMRFTAKEHE